MITLWDAALASLSIVANFLREKSMLYRSTLPKALQVFVQPIMDVEEHMKMWKHKKSLEIFLIAVNVMQELAELQPFSTQVQPM